MCWDLGGCVGFPNIRERGNKSFWCVQGNVPRLGVGFGAVLSLMGKQAGLGVQELGKRMATHPFAPFSPSDFCQRGAKGRHRCIHPAPAGTLQLQEDEYMAWYVGCGWEEGKEDA